MFHLSLADSTYPLVWILEPVITLFYRPTIAVPQWFVIVQKRYRETETLIFRLTHWFNHSLTQITFGSAGNFKNWYLVSRLWSVNKRNSTSSTTINLDVSQTGPVVKYHLLITGLFSSNLAFYTRFLLNIRVIIRTWKIYERSDQIHILYMCRY